MKLLTLYIENFFCYDKSCIDFTNLSAALIVGNKDGNDTVSNGVGKTTIFKAIEYVLFNQADCNLERLIRDDTNMCKIVLDFESGGEEYRVSRSRTRKGNTDLSLFIRNSVSGDFNEVYHSLDSTPLFDEKFWKDLSGRRAADTEKELAKILKINYKSFRNTVHFIQHDFAGLSTATPEKKKAILKEAFNLIVYSKLEKIAKEKHNSLSKEIDKRMTLKESLGDPKLSISELEAQINTLNNTLSKQDSLLLELNSNIRSETDKLNSFKEKYSSLAVKNDNLLQREKVLLSEKTKLESSVKEYKTKRSNTVKVAKELLADIALLKETQAKLIGLDYSQIAILSEKIATKKEEIAKYNAIIQHNLELYEELRIPLPKDAVCKHCRQELSEHHKQLCQNKINTDMQVCLSKINESKQEVKNANSSISDWQLVIDNLTRSKIQLEDINSKISLKNKEVADKNTIHGEYGALIDKFSAELVANTDELLLVQEEIKKSFSSEAESLNQDINYVKSNLEKYNDTLSNLTKETSKLISSKAILEHSLQQKQKDDIKLLELTKEQGELQEKANIYPLVLQAFSSTGIPNLIIQNILDDLQIEANTLLSQLRPDLQLSFLIEKTKGDGTQDDTLDILFYVNGKEREFHQLSGAMQLTINFSLKLGLSFLLQKIIGTDLKFLLLDEIDQPLDKSRVDAFADIVKFFQKDFLVLVITHNDRLKDKFSHAILVEQDINMISRAKVVSSW